MEILSNLVDGATAFGSGGLLGLLGGVTGAAAKFFQRKQEMAQEARRWAHEKDLLDLQIKRDREEDEHEMDMASQAGSWNALSASIESFQPTSPDNYRWVNAVRSLFRVVLTIGLLVMAAWMFDLVVTEPAVRAAFPDELFRELVRYMVFSVVFTASTAAIWWFADRALTPPEYKNR